MEPKHVIFRKLLNPFLIGTLLFTINFTFAQDAQSEKELVRARDFVRQNRYIDALPIFEKIAPVYPNDAEFHANYGLAILVNSMTIKDAEERKKEVVSAGNILRKAKRLGTENVLALHYLDLIERGGDLDSISGAASKEVEDAIREGEGYFGRGEYDKAFLAYERAYKLDPKSYEAAVFAGDCFYAQKKYAESEIWFARAAAINPNGEQAFRFWGDALVNQGKTKEALVKFAEAYIAEPNSRLTWDSFLEAAQNYGNRKSSPFIVIPSKENETEIVIDPNLLKIEDGTIHWNRFAEIRKLQIEKFNKTANGKAFISNVAQDLEAMKSVISAAKDNLQKDNGLKLSKSMENLIKLDGIGMLDVYTILFIHGGEESPEYKPFREKHRERMRKFLVDYFAEDKL